jgi:hypothetical protein
MALLESGQTVGRIERRAGPFLRSSYRDLPGQGAAALTIAPGRVPAGAADVAPASPAAAGAFALRAAVIEVRPGPSTWSIEIRRGDWWRLEDGIGAKGAAAASIGAADGLTWEGPPAAIVQAVVATLDDPEWFEVGLPVATPSVVLDGLGPWRLPEAVE